nr:Cna B-type domain-containing protein [uncultured Peptoniphilus sp.]
MKALQVHKKNYLLLILFMSVLLAFQFPSLIRAESESAAETEKIISEAPKESIPEKDVAQRTEEKKQATTEEESIAETEALPEEETLPENDGVSTEETQSEPAEETEKAAESEQATDEDEGLKQDDAPNAEPVKEEEPEKAAESEQVTDEDEGLKQDDAPITEPAKEEEPEEAEEPEVLKQGEVLEVDALAKEPMAFGAGAEESEKTIEVYDFDGLRDAITNAGNTKTTIKIMKSFELKATLTISKDQDITITSGANRDEANNKITPIGEDKITMPKEDDGVERRQELVKEAEEAGEKALKDTNLEKNPLPTVDIVIKRAKGFLETLFKIQEGGTLTLGTDNKDPLFIDGNITVKTEIEGGSFIDVSGTLVMNGGIIANGNNEKSGSAPIYVHQGGKFTMNGGRITSNKNISKGISNFNAAGGVYVDEGGEFTLKAGSIDNNHAPVGGVFLGKIFGNENGKRIPALFTMNGGFIVRNKGPLYDNLEPETENYGGGVHVDSLGNFIFKNGIIAGNESYRGGGVAINDNYVTKTNGVNYSNIQNVNYEDYIKYAGAYYTQNGGLIYKNMAKVHNDGNTSGAGGGLYINASTAKLNGGYLLNNKSENMGGGIYVSIVPHVLKLDHVLISQNKAIKGAYYHLSAGNGGGFWHCPAGNVDFEDFNSIYIFDNDASSGGKDIFTHGKKDNYSIFNGESYDFPKFLTNISPITEKGNIIKYLYEGKEVPEWMYHTDKAVSLQAIYDAQTKNEAWTNSKLFIMGNTALKGGGIGSNANTMPPGKPGNYEITIDKKWHQSIPEDKRPDKIWVDLFIGDAKYGEVELSKANGWTAKFENLPFTAEELKNKNIKYSIKERNDDFYSVVDETLKALEVERVFAGEKYPDNEYAAYYDKPLHKFMDYKIVFIHKDKNGHEVSREDIKINYNNDKWAGIVQNMLVGKFKDLKDIKITYHSYDKPYEPAPDWVGLGYNGLDADSNWYNDGGWHEAYILEKEDGTIEIQLPYLWTMYMGNPDGTTNDYYKNATGYKLNLVPNHRFTITNYPYSEIPVVKKWDESIEEKDIPDQIKVYLLKDGKRVKDKEGKDRYIILSKENGWKGNFDKLPFFELDGMGFEKYWVKEDSEIFIPLVTRKENSTLNIRVERDKDSDKYLIYKDYTGGYFRIKYIPFEVHYIYKDGDKEVKEVYTKKLEPYRVDGWDWHLDTVIKDIVMNGKFKDSDIEIKMYYDENGNPFPRNLGKYQAGWDEDDIVTNEGAYILKLVEENGKLVLYVPKLTDVEDEDNLLNIKTKIEEGKKYFELTNYYLPKHRLEIEKKWEANDPNSIPESLRVKIDGKYVDKEIVLSPEDWKYVEEFLGKGLLATNKYAFVEEDLVNFDGSQSIETSLEFSAEGKKVTFLDKDGKSISQEEFLKQIKGKKYSFELKEAAEDKAEVEIKYDKEGNLTIVYPVDVTITEVARVLFTNTERPPETPPGPNTRIIIVKKQWALEDGSKPADKVIVELYRDGKPTGKRIELSAANNWTGQFRNLEIADKSDPTREYLYTIREVGENNGSIELDDKKYDVIYAGDMVSGFTITNKEVPPEEPPETPEEPPETPEEPPETPEEPPETPPVIPPKTPKTPPKKPGSPQTGVDGVSGAFALMTSAAAGLFVLQRKKKED